MNDRTGRRQLALRWTPLALCLSTALAADPRAAAAGQGSHGAQGNERPAALLSVESCADDGGSDTLRSVVAGAVSGDTIDLSLLDCGVITLVTGEIEVPVDDLTINGPGRDALTIDGNYNGRVFRHSGAGTLTLSGVTVAHGLLDTATAAQFRNGYGGCILSDNGDDYGPSPYGSVAIIDSTVTGCRVIGSGELIPGRIRGGGIAAAGAITVQRSTISDCHLDNGAVFAGFFPGGGGGGLFAIYLITVTDSLIADNTSKITVNGQMRGGGISAYGGVAISNTIVTRNFVGCDTATTVCKFALGGGVDVLGPATISSSTISDNIAEAGQGVSGGGLGVRGNLSIADTTLSGNSAQGTAYLRNGGGMALNGGYDGQLSDTAVISGVTVTGNSSVKGGGIYAGASQRVSISNSTISGNTVLDSGGGIYLNSIEAAYPYSAYPLRLANSTITTNVSTGPRGGGGIVDHHLPELGISDFQSSIVAGNINVVADAILDADLAASTAAVSGANNLIVAASGVTLPPDTLVVEPMLGPLQDNGGATWTHALLDGSPAIDAGNNSADLDFDQRGQGFPRVSAAAADIGALEAGTADSVFADGFDGAAP